jgi:hypothetical protein
MKVDEQGAWIEILQSLRIPTTKIVQTPVTPPSKKTRAANKSLRKSPQKGVRSSPRSLKKSANSPQTPTKSPQAEQNPETKDFSEEFSQNLRELYANYLEPFRTSEYYENFLSSETLRLGSEIPRGEQKIPEKAEEDIEMAEPGKKTTNQINNETPQKKKRRTKRGRSEGGAEAGEEEGEEERVRKRRRTNPELSEPHWKQVKSRSFVKGMLEGGERREREDRRRGGRGS